MMRKKEDLGIFDYIWKFFSSLKLTVAVLVSLAAASVIGTVVPQSGDAAAFFRDNHPVLYSVFSVLDIFDMYHSWWFRLLVSVLAANIAVCSVHRLSATWKFVLAKKPRFDLSRVSKNGWKKEISVDRSATSVEGAVVKYVERKFGHFKTERFENGFRIFTESGRRSRLGVYIVHTSVILLLAGGLIGSMFGFEGYAAVEEGKSADHILDKNNNPIKLDFSIRCDDFNVKFYKTGEVEEYRSKLSILENKQVVLQKDIIVNDPLRYKGINIFQSSYGKIRAEAGEIGNGEIRLNFTSVESGMTYEKKTIMGREFDLPEGLGKFAVREYRKSHVFMGMQDIGENLLGIWTRPEGEPVEIAISLRYPNFDKMRKGQFVVSFEGSEEKFYTGLHVTEDPGVVAVYIGFVMMIAGFFVSFFISHRRFCVEVSGKGAETLISVAGITDGNKLDMEALTEKIATNLAKSAENKDKS